MLEKKMGDYKIDFLIVGTVFPILAGLSVALRFKARFLAKQKLLADDWLALAAMVNTAPVQVSHKANECRYSPGHGQ